MKTSLRWMPRVLVGMVAASAIGCANGSSGGDEGGPAAAAQGGFSAPAGAGGSFSSNGGSDAGGARTSTGGSGPAAGASGSGSSTGGSTSSQGGAGQAGATTSFGAGGSPSSTGGSPAHGGTSSTGGSGSGGKAPTCGAVDDSCTSSATCCSGLSCVEGQCESCESPATYCPPAGGNEGTCFTGGPACSTVTKCSDGTYHACADSVTKYNCATDVCECADPAYPVFCDAKGSVPASCWSPGTWCPSVTDCSGSFKSCGGVGESVNCSTDKCECDEPGHTLYCPAHGGAPGGCWSNNTACSTLTECADGTDHACADANAVYECSTNTCKSKATNSCPSSGCPGDCSGDSVICCPDCKTDSSGNSYCGQTCCDLQGDCF